MVIAREVFLNAIHCLLLEVFPGITNNVITNNVIKVVHSKKSCYDIDQKIFCIKGEINLRKCRFGIIR